jgi:hypothetical protein
MNKINTPVVKLRSKNLQDIVHAIDLGYWDWHTGVKGVKKNDTIAISGSNALMKNNPLAPRLVLVAEVTKIESIKKSRDNDPKWEKTATKYQSRFHFNLDTIRIVDILDPAGNPNNYSDGKQSGVDYSKHLAR